jgi:hypothetical protein
MKSQRGLTSHLRQSAYCQEVQKQQESGCNLEQDSKPKAKGKVENDDQTQWLLKQQPVVNANDSWRASKIRKLLGPFTMNRLLMSAGGDPKRLGEALLQLQMSKIDPKQQNQVYHTLNKLLASGDMEVKRREMNNEEEGGNEQGVFWDEEQDDDDEPSDSEQLGNDNSESAPEEEEFGEELGVGDQREREKQRRECFERFKAYVAYSARNRIELTDMEKSSVRLMHKLIKKKAPLDTYDDVMEWHLQETGQCSSLFVSRQQLMQKLRERYHMTSQYAVPCMVYVQP